MSNADMNLLKSPFWEVSVGITIILCDRLREVRHPKTHRSECAEASIAQKLPSALKLINMLIANFLVRLVCFFSREDIFFNWESDAVMSNIMIKKKVM